MNAFLNRLDDEALELAAGDSRLIEECLIAGVEHERRRGSDGEEFVLHRMFSGALEFSHYPCFKTFLREREAELNEMGDRE